MLKNIIALFSSKHTGDSSHYEALKQALDLKEKNLIFTKLEKSSEIDSVMQGCKAEETILLAIGEKGLGELFKLPIAANSNMMVGLSIHQYFDSIETLTQNKLLHFISIPEATEDKASVIKSMLHHYTLGVPAKNLTVAELEKKFEAWNIEPKPSIDQPSIIVMLPGDAPDSTGEIRNFDAASATKLLENLTVLYESLGKNYNVIIENGPRTGKHTFDSPDKAHTYIKGEDKERAVDEISKQFIAGLESKNINYTFFNFAFEIDEATNSKTSNSVYDQMLYLSASNEKNIFILPGESISMLSQIPFYLKPEQIIVYKPSSMNEEHNAIFDVIFSRGHLRYFGDDRTVIEPKIFDQLFTDDATNVASFLLDAHNQFVANLGEGVLEHHEV